MQCMLALSTKHPATLHASHQRKSCVSLHTADRRHQHPSWSQTPRRSWCQLLARRRHSDRGQSCPQYRSYTDEGWLAFKPDHDNRGMEEAEGGALVEARNAKRARSDDGDSHLLNGAPQLAASLPAGKAPAVHTKALRSVLKGTAHSLLNLGMSFATQAYYCQLDHGD